MDFRYSDWFKQSPAVGYETLLYDCFTGDATLFQRADQVEAFPNYAPGSAGPACADELLKRDGRAWRAIR